MEGKIVERKRVQHKGAVDLIEEAVHLLRLSPAYLLASYYVGTLPFILALLYFWADMSRSPLAAGYCAGESLGLAMLFVWMKSWQAIFARQLRARLGNEPPPRWTVRRLSDLVAVQTIIQPSAVVALPLALILVLPFGWVYALYQHVSAVRDGEVGWAIRRAWQQAWLWPGQNHLLMLILSIFGLFVFVNVVIGIFLTPHLLRILLGLETSFSRGGFGLLNTTLLAAALGITYLCVDPLVKAVYVLRDFYGSSIQTGEDLMVELKKFRSPAKRIVSGLMFSLAFVSFSLPAVGAETAGPHRTPETANPILTPSALNESIEQVMSRRQYVWRLPRERARQEDEKGLFARAIGWFLERLDDALKAIGRWLASFGRWLEKLMPQRQGSRSRSGIGWDSIRPFVWFTLATMICALAFFIWRTWRRRGRRPVSQAGGGAPHMPDLADERTAADQLPVDRWLALARELAERGELRLALRSLYLSTLAYLAEQGVVTLARYKSNGDYETELQRRAHAQKDLPDLFARNVFLFERAWYGMHEVTQQDLKAFTANQERITASVEA